MSVFTKLKCLILCFLLGACVSIDKDAPMVQPQSSMPTGMAVPIPSGFANFCKRNPQECMLPNTDDVVQAIEEARLKTTNLIVPVPDADDEDFWQIRSDIGPGDCEDFALTMRALLREQFPAYSHNFLLATAWTETGQYHAVLAIETEKGTIVCDIRYSRCMPWDYFPYTWNYREVAGENYWRQAGVSLDMAAVGAAAMGTIGSRR